MPPFPCAFMRRGDDRKWAISGTRFLISKAFKLDIQLYNGVKMAKRDKSYMPQSTAGLIRYFDESKESIKIKPEHVLIVCGILIAIEIMLKFVM